MRMEMDTLDYTTERKLLIEYKNGKQRLVAYLSKLLNEIEYNYEINDKGILAIIRRLENWRYLLKGTKFQFKVWIDSKNL